MERIGDKDTNADTDTNYEKMIKIRSDLLEEHNAYSDVLCRFGDWVNNIGELKKSFSSAKPFEHVVIDDFLDTEYAGKICAVFPENRNDWHKYENPLEVKFAFDDIDALSSDLKNYFYYLSTNKMIELFRDMTNIDSLTYDEYLHGAGLHSHPRDGRLNIHLDYEKHPYSGKERRLNIILFLSKDWDPAWNGANELWDENVTKVVAKTEVKFNRAIIFKTNDISWHGLSEKITCPENKYRNTLAYYYVSPLSSHKGEADEYRKKARYRRKPTDEPDVNMDELYKIRSCRRVNDADRMRLFPNWKKEN